jgi:hypothetical protein
MLIQFTVLHPAYLRYKLILSCCVSLDLPSRLCPSGFPTKILYTFFFSPIHAKRRNFFMALESVITLVVQHTNHAVLHNAVFSSFLSLPTLLGPDIFLRTLFSNTLSVTNFLEPNC